MRAVLMLKGYSPYSPLLSLIHRIMFDYMKQLPSDSQHTPPSGPPDAGKKDSQP